MSVYKVEVDVALRRPPRRDKTLYYVVEADTGQDAELIACQMAYARRGVSMPVGSVVTDWEEGAP